MQTIRRPGPIAREELITPNETPKVRSTTHEIPSTAKFVTEVARRAAVTNVPLADFFTPCPGLSPKNAHGHELCADCSLEIQPA